MQNSKSRFHVFADDAQVEVRQSIEHSIQTRLQITSLKWNYGALK